MTDKEQQEETEPTLENMPQSPLMDDRCFLSFDFMEYHRRTKESEYMMEMLFNACENSNNFAFDKHIDFIAQQKRELLPYLNFMQENKDGKNMFDIACDKGNAKIIKKLLELTQAFKKSEVNCEYTFSTQNLEALTKSNMDYLIELAKSDQIPEDSKNAIADTIYEETLVKQRFDDLYLFLEKEFPLSEEIGKQAFYMASPQIIDHFVELGFNFETIRRTIYQAIEDHNHTDNVIHIIEKNLIDIHYVEKDVIRDTQNNISKIPILSLALSRNNIQIYNVLKKQNVDPTVKYKIINSYDDIYTLTIPSVTKGGFVKCSKEIIDDVDTYIKTWKANKRQAEKALKQVNKKPLLGFRNS